jgi:GDP-L-fucose synthase
MRKAVEAKLRGDSKLVVWGSGNPRREFLMNRDLADACIRLMTLGEEAISPLFSNEHPPLINIGTGVDVTIRELAELIARVVGLECELEFDSTKQDGTPRKVLDVSRLNALGWKAATGLEEGLKETYEAVQGNLATASV